MSSFNFDDYNQRFGGIARLYGTLGLKALLHSKVMVIGLGGVGSWAAEALARSGVGEIILVDLDDVCITNMNRQLCASTNDIGKLKTTVLKERILSINPQCSVIVVENFFTAKTSDEILAMKMDYIIDAIDSSDTKCLLISKAKALEIPIITTGGAAGKSDPTQVKLDDLAFTVNDSLLQQIRKKLRREYGFQKSKKSSLSGRKRMGIAAVYSPEEPVFPDKHGGVCKVPDPESNLILDCESGMGSVTHLTGTFGFFAASFVIKEIVNK